ncbi:hypothetical protein ACGFX4_40420 [Kitasatospora sp. NPDC048365]|uniref:hypothetical protein n=1 Tax=Kitasatospora sp. NPDC048365 TaxID=3364050 RepID=UPI00371BA34C
MTPPDPTPQSRPSPTPPSPTPPFLTARTAIVLLSAAVIGLVAGGLAFLDGTPAAGAVLIGLTAAGASVLGLHTLIG